MVTDTIPNHNCTQFVKLYCSKSKEQTSVKVDYIDVRWIHSNKTFPMCTVKTKYTLIEHSK